MIKKIILLPALALSLSFSTSAFANMHMGDNGKCSCPKAHMKKMYEGLELTSEQKDKIKEIKEDAKKEMKANYEQMKYIKSEMKDLVKSEKIDESKLNSLIEKKKELTAANMKAKIMTKNKIYNLLNEQQKTKFSAMMDKLEQKRMERMNNNMSDNGMDNDND